MGCANSVNQSRKIGQNEHNSKREDNEACLPVLRLFEHGQIPFLLIGRSPRK